MKKIMFNDKYQLTKAVLEGRKTMTRRLIKPDYETVSCLNVNYEDHWHGELDGETFDIIPRYEVGEVVAIAQSYKEIGLTFAPYQDMTFQKKHVAQWGNTRSMKGWNNKMYVRADLMPHHIRITDIKMERLQDISREDCLLEGIEHDVADGAGLWWWDMEDMKLQNELLRHEWNGKEGLWFWDTPQGAFAALIDKINGKGTWNSNPFVFAYTFKLED